MPKNIFLLLFTCSMIMAANANGHNGPPAPDEPTELLERVIKAHGGKEALEAVTSYTYSATFEGLSGFPGTYKVWAISPNLRRVDWDIRYIRQTTAFNGESGYQDVVAPREIRGDELKRLERSSVFLPVDRLLSHSGAATIHAGDHDGQQVIFLALGNDDRERETFCIDPQTFLIICEERFEQYEEGLSRVTYNYGDYRRVGQIALPFKVSETRPDISYQIEIDKYEINPSIDRAIFESKEIASSDEFELKITTIPRNIYSEKSNIWYDGWRRFWAMPYSNTDQWTLHLLVQEKHGRYVEPSRAKVRLFSNDILRKEVTITADALKDLQRYPATRFNPQREIYNFRHSFSEPSPLEINRVDYEFVALTDSGKEVSATITIPIQNYKSANEYIFPIRGNFMIINGHEHYELDHSYEWSQQFAYDIVSLGPNLELMTPEGQFYGFGRTKIVAPADGVVVYARNDVPDGRVKRDYLKMADGKWAIGGNIVMIKHKGDEYSLFAHMREGSVQVQVGQEVRQGDQIGLLGASGSPGHPHLHYQLQSSPDLFVDDGLPIRFNNVKSTAWFENVPLGTIKRGVFLRAD